MKFLKKLNLTVVVFCVCCIAFVAFLAYNPSHAYFQVHKDAIGVNTAKVDLLFDKYDESVFTNTTTYTGPTLNQNAEWGTEANPYIIRKKNHINNLAMLQKAGYFAEKSGQSYFVVCDLVGKPVAINCSDDSKMEIAPIGTPDNPFTGNINGAYIAGTANYTLKLDDTTSKAYTVSQSTIANLSVVATEETPDVGFFGRLGFVGKKQNETDGSISIVADGTKGPYSATINNVLFADIAVKNNVKVSNLGTWWANFTGYDAAYENCNETHHVGIVAGHVEFATLTNISVYYTPNKDATKAHVAAFELAGDNSTDKNNYYSITGILGTVVYVNPAIGEGGSLNSAPAISDPQLSEELLSGGGGGTSGMLTGYMLAENIFDRKDDDNTMTVLDAYAEAYDVRNVTEDDESIFSVVTMKERLRSENDWEYKNYYYFADTVFTFAMTTKLSVDKDGNPLPNATQGSNTEYLVKIWNLEDVSQPPPIKLTSSTDDWSYQIDEGKSEIIYHLEAVTSLSNNTYYVLAYQHNNEGPIYILDITNNNGFVSTITPITPVVVEGQTKYEIERDGTTGKLTSFYINDPGVQVSTSTSNPKPVVCSASFLYNSKNHIDNHDDTHGKDLYRAIISANGARSLAMYQSLKNGDRGCSGTIEAKTVGTGDTGRHDLYAWTGNSSLNWQNWQISGSNGAFTVSGQFVFRNQDTNSYAYLTSYSPKLVFDTNSNTFSVLGIEPLKLNNGNRVNLRGYNPNVHLDYNSSYVSFPAFPALSESQHDEFMLFAVTETSESAPAYDILPDTEPVKTFDPSTDVLFCEPAVKTGSAALTSTAIAATKNYTVVPLINKQWNDGRGQYLTSLNHIVKMSAPSAQNYNFNFSETPLGQWFGDNGRFDTNTGGVVLVPLGTTGVNFTMPAGTIAFYINKASADDPSEINIIVAVNPEEGSSSIGLWGPQSIGTGSSTFDAQNPNQAFALPVSKTATGASNKSDMTHITGYYEEGSDTLITGTDGKGFYTYLGGDIVFVGCTFEVTQPGVYMLAPMYGSNMSVAYFSVSGAAGYGGDGTGGSPLGDVDFVYDNNSGTVITVDKKFQEGTHSVPDESLTDTYYPSYYYLRMLPNTEDPKTENGDGIIRNEKVYVRRYTVSTPPTIGASQADRKRIIQMSCTDTDTHLMGLSAIFQDIDYATIGTSS